jgi:hypothetical protein
MEVLRCASGHERIARFVGTGLKKQSPTQLVKTFMKF